MLVVVRTDASQEIGTGHVARCLTLAAALRNRGATVHFICRYHSGQQAELITAQGHGISVLPMSVSRDREQVLPHSHWLGATWKEDMEQTREVIHGLTSAPAWLVVDHYGIDARWESALRASVDRILVIDDLADRDHDCDLLLDQNLIVSMADRYRARIPTGCAAMIGPRYALLRPEYERLHDRLSPRRGPIRRILVSFGGMDNDNLTGRTVEAFARLDLPGVETDVVVPNGNPHAESVRRIAGGRRGMRFHPTVPSLATLMAQADLAIAAAGASSWERLSLGLPSLVISAGDNQRPIARGLEAAEVATWLGHKDDVDTEAIARAIGKAVSAGSDEEQSHRCAALVDGRGVRRVCAAMVGPETVQVRHARPADGATVREIMGSMADSEWLRAVLADVSLQRLYVTEEAQGAEIAVTRFWKTGDSWNRETKVAPSASGEATLTRITAGALLRFREDEAGPLAFRDSISGTSKGNEPLRVAICSDAESWINEGAAELIIEWTRAGHAVTWVHDARDLTGGDICLFLSYSRIVSADRLKRFANNLVVHASALPKGRGWSPLTWQILEGASTVPITLFEAGAEVDSGPIYRQLSMQFDGTELIDELRAAVSEATRVLCADFVANYPGIVVTAKSQEGEATYYIRRRPVDSRLDPDRPLRDQFNLIRTADPDRYPVWFELAGKRYAVAVRHIPSATGPT